MTNKQAINILLNEQKCIDRNDGVQCNRKCGSCDLVMDVETIREAYSMAISALQAQDAPDTNVGNMISRQAAINSLHMHLMYRMGTDSNKKRLDDWINNLPSAQPEPSWDCEKCMMDHTDEMEKLEAELAIAKSKQPEPHWIPIKWHDCTDEDREEYGFSNDIVAVFDCEMPDDDQPILVTTSHGYVNQDVCYIDDGFYLDSGYDWIDDIKAWMPLPEPYGGEQDESD